MPATPLHAALGDPRANIDFDMIVRACNERVEERGDLDWKQQLPLTAIAEDKEARQRQQLALAKDIAAMANSGGGMVVYGVAESREAGTSAADRIVPVGPIDERDLRAIRQVAGNLIYPPVAGLEFATVAPSQEPEQGVLVLLIPDSYERPHLVHPHGGRDWFGAPYRHGPDTEWMVERQLANAYASRELGRQRRDEDFESQFSAFTSVLRGDASTRWVVVLAVPEQPRSDPRALTLQRADQVIREAWSSPVAGGFALQDLTEQEVTRRGLLRFYREGSREILGAGPAIARARVEVHGDGSVAAAFTRDGAIPGEGRQLTQVPVEDIEATALDVFALLWSTSSLLGIRANYRVRMTIVPPTEIFRTSDPTIRGAMQRWDERRVYGWLAVDGPVLTAEGQESAVTSWMELVGDVIHQAGSAPRFTASDVWTQLLLDP